MDTINGKLQSDILFLARYRIALPLTYSAALPILSYNSFIVSQQQCPSETSLPPKKKLQRE
jgi:hypothetical protein